MKNSTHVWDVSVLPEGASFEPFSAETFFLTTWDESQIQPLLVGLKRIYGDRILWIKRSTNGQKRETILLTNLGIRYQNSLGSKSSEYSPVESDPNHQCLKEMASTDWKSPASRGKRAKGSKTRSGVTSSTTRTTLLSALLASLGFSFRG